MAHAPDDTTSQSQTAAAAALVDRWADYAKASSLYPEASTRVTEAFGALQAAIRSYAIGGEVQVTSTADEFSVGGLRQEIAPGSKAEWLRDRLRTCTLDGVVLSASVEPGPMHAFCARLVELHRRGGKAETLAGRWPITYPGVELIHRQFDGGFTGEDAAEDLLVAGGGGEDAGTGTQRDVVDRLSVEGPVSASVVRISEQLSAVTLPGEGDGMAPRLAKQLLKHVVQCIPVEERESYTQTVTMTSEILRCVESSLEEEGLSTESLSSKDDVDLRSIVYAASRKLFGHQMPGGSKEDLEERAEKGHRGDDEITDDLSGLLLELNGLPIVHTWRLDHAAIDHRGEQLDMLLHYVLNAETATDESVLRQTVRKVLRDSSEADYESLREVVTKYAGTEAEDDTRQRVIQFLSESRQANILRKLGMLTADTVLASFPRDFGLYLDSVDLGRPEERAELLSLLQRLTPERIQGCMPRLVSGRESLLIQDRGHRLLGLKVPEALPFVEIVLSLEDHASRTAVAEYLRVVGRDHKACALLHLSDSAHVLKNDYLRDAARSIQYGGIFPEVIRHQVGVLTRHLESPMSTVRARLDAIRALARLGTLEANVALRHLLRKRFGVFNAEPGEIRAAARHALERMAEEAAGNSDV